jgi:hypothetical protein
MIDLKSVIKDEHINMLVDGIVPEESLHLAIKKNFDTACWSFNEKSKKHTIFIGDKILDAAKKEGKLGIEYYVNSYLHHEMSHAINTLRDMKSLQEWLKTHKIPFSLFNLFEDARIESIWRTMTDRMFNWTDYEDIPKIEADTNATSLLFSYIQKEGKLRSPLLKMLRVKEYYYRITDAKATEDLYPILLDWIEEFPETIEDTQQLVDDGFLSEGDLDFSIKMQGSAFSEEMHEDTETIAGESEYQDIDNEVPLVDEPSYPIEEYSTTTDVSLMSTRCSYSFDKDKAFKLMPIMQKLFKAKTRKISQSNATNRINIRNYTAMRYDKLYKKKTLETKGKRKFNLMIDCSASMSGSPITNARTFCFIISEFARLNLLEGNLILSGVDGYRNETKTFKFPVDDETIGQIIANGEAEGLEGSSQLTKKLLKDADLNFVFTDGNITDAPIKSKGLNLFGIYIGNPESCNLSKWFDKYLARETLDELIQKLLIKM